MGYTTEFQGKFKFSRELTLEEIKTINDFSEERHENFFFPGDRFPSYWCNWAADEKGLFWNEQEKFYNYIEWLQHLIVNFFTPWNVQLNGKIKWQGEEPSDIGTIVVKNNVISY